LLLRVANHLKLRLDVDGKVFKRVAFADAVKNTFCNAFGVSREFLEEWKVKADPPPGFEKNIRQGLQFIGDGFRTIVPTIWLDIAFREQSNRMIFSDTRYFNEFRKIKEVGGHNILIWRPGFENDDPNGSEAQIGELIRFFKGIGLEHGPVTSELISDLASVPVSDLHPAARDVDFFLVNDEDGLERLHKKIDEDVVPWLKNVG
jgi:hypothetical protein